MCGATLARSMQFVDMFANDCIQNSLNSMIMCVLNFFRSPRPCYSKHQIV